MRGNSSVSDLQEDGWVGRWMDSWKDGQMEGWAVYSDE